MPRSFCNNSDQACAFPFFVRLNAQQLDNGGGDILDVCASKGFTRLHVLTQHNDGNGHILGLFGAVWGVMMAFSGIAIAGKSDFTALAPGVAGALLTTVAGLVVAIPSLVGYNILNSTIREMTTDMDNFAEGFMAQVKLEQVGSGSAEAGQ